MSKKRGRANKKLKYKNVMQRVPFKNRLSWRQREKGRYFYTHSISKTARFPCCCDQVKEENNYKKSNLDRLRRNGQWRALTKREILIPKCSNQDEDDGMDRRLFFVYYFKGTYKTNKKKKISEGARRSSTSEVFSFLSGTNVLTLEKC